MARLEESTDESGPPECGHAVLEDGTTLELNRQQRAALRVGDPCHKARFGTALRCGSTELPADWRRCVAMGGVAAAPAAALLSGTSALVARRRARP